MELFQKKKVDFLLMNLGVLVIAADIYFFKEPNGFAFGGVSGFAIILSNIFQQLNTGIVMLALNIFLLIVGYIVLGKTFGVKTVYCTVLLSFTVWLLEILFPLNSTLTNQKFLEFVYAVFLPGIGSAIVFKAGGTTGGTDIIAKIVQKYFHIKMGTAILMADFLIALLAGVIFGIEGMLYSVVGVIMKSFAVDTILESMNIYKVAVIVSEYPESVKDYVCNHLERGATVHHGHGAYTEETKEIITTVLSRRQAVKLQLYMRQLDPQAFITFTNSAQIIGNGFVNLD